MSRQSQRRSLHAAWSAFAEKPFYVTTPIFYVNAGKLADQHDIDNLTDALLRQNLTLDTSIRKCLLMF